MADARREQRGPEYRLLITGLLLTAAAVMSPASALDAAAGTLPASPHSSRSEAVPPQTAVQVGSEAPDIALDSIDGDALRLSALKGEKNVIVVFFRGTW